MATWSKKKRIGDGGFGEVYTCTRDEDSTLYALKELQSNSSPDAVERFITEVRILSSLDHPNIVKVVGKRLNSAPQFYVMPLYKRSLENELATLAGNEERMRPIFSAILDGVEYAHGQGVLHRDLKPLNVLMNSDTDVVVSDFGLGRIVDSESTRKTFTGQGMGSYFYTAPEQFADAKHVDHRADIFSLGRILYAMVSGTTPVAQDTSNLAPGIAFIVNKCTQQDAGKRFQSVADLKTAWQSLFDPSLQDSVGELKALSAKATAPATLSSEKLRKLLNLLLKFQEDPDLIQESLMEIDPAVIGAMFSMEPDAVRGILKVFTDLVAQQNWPFAYTDKLANRCKALFAEINDIAVRAEILGCLLILGVDHNRWHVFEVFADLMHMAKTPAEALAAKDRLALIPERKRKEVTRSLKLARVHQLLRPLFEFEKDDQ